MVLMLSFGSGVQNLTLDECFSTAGPWATVEPNYYFTIDYLSQFSCPFSN
jgi:hypothetical protein